MDDTALRLAIEDLSAAYADCIDDDRLEEWPEFFVDDCRYLITSRDAHEQGLRHGVIYCASKGMLVDRVTAMRRANMFEPHRYRHITGPVRIDRVADGIAEARSNFLCVRIMHDGDTQLFATGRYLDRIAVDAAPLRFKERLVILDSRKIDTLLVIPL
ncbi:MAG: aromatic-ring-hydroxylating dioxygenase subunit beta [Thiohalocapsa sp.]